MDVIWFVGGLAIGAIVGVLMGYCAACLSILRKTSIKEWEREHDRPKTHIDVNEHGRACCANCGCDDWCLADGSQYCPNCGLEVAKDGDHESH